MRAFFIAPVLAAVLLLPRPASAWIDPGHMLMARLVYEQLKPDVRRKYVQLLKAHPRYREDLLAEMPEGFSDPDLYAWMKAGTWADLIRDKANPLNAAHHKPNWHYVNYAFIPDPAGREQFKQPEPTEEGGEIDNILKALKHNEARLKDGNLPAADRAIALCWMLHLSADIHQPMHATTLFSNQFPEGDRGGNEFLVKTPTGVQRLHIYWDLLLGTDATPGAIEALCEKLGDRPALRNSFTEEFKRTTYRQWADESHALGISAAYLDGKLDGAVRKPYEADRTLPVPSLPPGYEEKARELAQKRIALAAFRLANKLNAD